MLQHDHVPLQRLQPFNNNPRTITQAAQDRLRASLAKWGIYKPLVVWEDAAGRPVVVGGNQRLGVLQLWEQAGDVPTTIDTAAIPIVWFKGDEAQAKLVALRDNNNDGDWDWDALPDYVAELGTLLDDAKDLELTGFDAATIADLGELAAAVDVNLDRFASPGLDPEPPAPGPPSQSHVGRRLAKFTIGNVRGNIPIELYGRFLQVFERQGAELGSTDIPSILTAMLDKLGD